MTKPNRSEDHAPSVIAQVSEILGKTNWAPAVIVIQILSLVFLGFVAGTAVSYFRVFPYTYFRQAYMAAVAVYEDQFAYTGQYGQITSDAKRRPEQAQRSADQESLVRTTRHDSAAAYNGYTLFSVAQGQTQKTRLISMNGRVVHDWHLPFSDIWDETAAVPKPESYSRISVRNTFLYPNGDLLAIYVGFGTPWGHGIVKMNKDSELIWKHLQQVHHDLDVGDDGRIYVLTHEIVSDVRPGLEQFEPPIIDDRVVILSQDGEELASISILEAFRDSPFANVLDLQNSYTSKGDVLHTNGVEVVRPSQADKFPMADEGDILLSFREIDTIALLDPDTGQIIWALRGPWHHQHDPDLLDNGNILIFDNEGDLARGGLSRILEFDPSTLEIVWSFESDDSEIFYSQVRGAQQRLPNGNTLITESENGRLLEVTPDKQVAWEYYIPFVGENDGELVKIVYPSLRYAPQDLSFEFAGPTKWSGN